MEFNGSQALIIILALIVGGLVWRQFTKWKRGRDSESTSTTDDGSGEENEALRRDSELTLRTDDASHKEYDVLLNFGGPDTRDGFTNSLYHRLRDAGIRVYFDEEDLRVGKETGGELLKALDKSRIYIPIISKGYANSSRYLREVAHMVEHASTSDGKKEILPIFYDVDPDDVKLETNLYRKAMPEHKMKFGSNELKRWENALFEVARLKGWDLKGKGQGEEIDLIVEQVSHKLITRHMTVTEHLVENSSQVEAIMELLDVGFDGVRFVGIHGMGGVGKTTLAKLMFNKLSSHFEGCYFLEDVRASSQSRDGLLKLQKKLLSGFVSSTITDQIENVDGAIKMIKRVFRNKKVLIILDDVDEKEQLENLAGKSDWFCSGSRIIITTREESILKTQVDQPKGILPYEVLGMRFDLALDLFYKYAFRSESAVKEYEDPSREIVRAVGMLPLAVVVIGSHLFDLGNNLRHLDKREVWDETLKQLKQGPFDKVRESLMISYKQLEDKEKEVFLDIACFFTSDDITYPLIMWKDCGYYPATALSILCYRSLVKIRGDNRFWMHDQVRDFGRYILLEEYPRKFCRVWIHEKALNLLERKERNEDVELLSLMFNNYSFTPEELACLPKLSFLRVKESDFSGNFENLLSELRWLSWHSWQITFYANNFHFSNLVVLDLSDSNIGDGWGGWSQMKMDRLKVLDLRSCIGLKETPDFSNFLYLEKLILAGCVKLIAIDRSIGKLKHLTTLNIKGCRSLGALPQEVGALQSLTEVIMPQTFQPFNLPKTFGNLESLSSLILDEHFGISQLPSYIGGLVRVTHLSLRCCVGIEKLPCSLGKMEMLVELDLSMSGIVELPDSIEYLKKLKVIRVNYTMIRKFPHTIGQVEMLEELHAKKCWDLTDENLEEIGKLSHLKILNLSYTHVSRFPTVLGCLQTLELGSSYLQEVPELPSSLTHLHVQARRFPSIPNLSSLVSLDYLELSRLIVSREEPDPSWMNNLPMEEPIHSLPCGLSTLKCRGIGLRPPLSDLRNLSVLCVIEYPISYFSISQELTNLTELKLSKCKFVEEIYGLSLLKNLQHLNLHRLDKLINIQGLSELESLLYFRISDCYKIERLPNLSKSDKLQHIELEACPKIKAIEGIKGLESLLLDSHGCIVLERLLDVSRSTWISRNVPECQVFLSFSGLDNSYCLLDVLYKNLVRHQISTFRDNDILSSGDGFGEELLRVLNNSHIYIPFLSKNYASSCWCLRELAHMVKGTSNSYGKKIILPILYDVTVNDVKLESTLYRSALEKHRRKFGDEVEQWESALREVAEIRGFNLNSNSHGEVIELIVEEVLRRLSDRVVDGLEQLIEDHCQVKAIIEKLDVDSGGVRFIGIHGMGGIGKTTLAKVVFNKLLLQFDSVCFLQNIRESSQHSLDGLVNLQKKLLSSVLDSRDTVQIRDIGDGMDQIKRVCSTKKVLIVLDDLDKKEQLQKLAGNSSWFGLGSRIIITTRDESILMTPVESFKKLVLNQPKGILAYEVHEMEFGRALNLFCKHAFRRDFPVEGHDHLVEKIVRSVGMLPLAIVGIGSFCFRHKIGEWEDELKQLNKGPLKVVRDALMISYEGLKDEEKEVFLDIACFFTNEDQTYPVIMWDDCNYCPQSAISVLLQQSLIKIKDNKFWMHDQVRDLGRHIVLEECPCKFSRVWTHEDALKLLERKEGTSKIEALRLNKYGCGSYTSEQFKELTNLRFLEVNGVNFIGDFQNLLPHLRWLRWERCPSEFTVANFLLKKLVVLTLSWSEISDNWGGWGLLKMATKLKVLNLTSCHFLRRTPDLSSLVSLEILILEDCKNLEEIHPSIEDIKTLVSLNVSRCRRLEELPAGVGKMEKLRELILDHSLIQEIPILGGCLTKLEILSAQGCSRLVELPKSIGSLVSLTKLDLSFTGIKELPEIVGSLKGLETLDASNSTSLTHISNSIGHLASLSLLNLSCCPKLAQLPDSIGSLLSLQHLLLWGCLSLREIPDLIGQLTSLTELDLNSTMIADLPESIGSLQNLRILDIRDTQITELSSAIEMLAKLHLCVKKNHLETMPLKTQREASAHSKLCPRENMEKIKDEARQQAADVETSYGNYAIAAVENVVGIDDRVKHITDLLEMEVDDDVRIIGIYGTDGIGKTTLAKAVYNRISSCFDSCSFLAEFKETLQNSHGIQFLQTKLICDILEQDREDPSFEEPIDLFLDIFQDMKVLIVVDDVEKESHLHDIVGNRLHWFGPGSRIIVTSENKEILKEYEPEKARTYMVRELNDGQAFELFCKHAFRMQSSIPEYDGLASHIVNATEKLPLAVEVVGSILQGKSIQEWERMVKSMKLFTMSSQRTTVGLEEILDICYKELDQQQKDIFLDIACFFSVVDARIGTYMWPNCYPSSGCILMPLAKIGENNELQMHRLLRCLGKRIFKQEGSGDPSSRRFCTQDMVLNSMNREKGIENVEACDSCILTAESFASMPAISFLKLDDAKVSGDFAGAFPTLRWLFWQRCPREFDAINFVLRELVILDLSWSKVTEDWGGWTEIKMEKLKVLNLTGCSDLLITPDFSGYKDLEILILEGCSRLVKLDPSIGHLKRLVSLNVKFCSQLNGLPVELGRTTALKELFIDGTSVREIPISIGNLKQLEILSGFNCFPLTHLPSSISYLTALSKLQLDGAKITDLPSSLGELLNLRRLSLRDCRYMEELPDSIGKMGSLEELDISATIISELPDSIRHLQSLRVLRMDSSFIRAFPREIGSLTKLEELHASCCRSLKGAIPGDIEGLHHLRSLTLGHSSISSLPPEISTISGLHTLDLTQCNDIEELPELPTSLICLRVSSKRMKAIPLLEDLKELEELCLSDGDPKARQPPSNQPMPESNVKQMIDKPSFSILFPKLRKLDLSLSQVIKLKFELTDTTQQPTLPCLSLKEVCELPTMLSVFKLYHSAIEEIEGLERLKALKRIDISNCKIRNLDGIGQLTSLRSLILSDCDCLSLPDLSNLKSLKVLEIRRCKMIRQIEGIEKLTSLKKLNISECPAENSLQVENYVMLDAPQF